MTKRTQFGLVAAILILAACSFGCGTSQNNVALTGTWVGTITNLHDQQGNTYTQNTSAGAAFTITFTSPTSATNSGDFPILDCFGGEFAPPLTVSESNGVFTAHALEAPGQGLTLNGTFTSQQIILLMTAQDSCNTGDSINPVLLSGDVTFVPQEGQ
jgi:hypothetical protein